MIPLRNDSVLWDKRLWRKVVILAPPTLYPQKTFDTRIFVKHRRVPLRRFLVLWDDKLLMEYRDITFSSSKFSIPEFSDTLMGSPTKFFGAVIQQIFNRKSLYSLLRHNFFDSRNFLKHRSFPLRNDSVVWDKTIWRKIVILAPPTSP